MIRGLPHKMAHLHAAPALAVQTCQSAEPVHPLFAALGADRPRTHHGLRMKGYDNIMFELRTKFGTAVSVGDSVKVHRRDEDTLIEGGAAPHKPSSSGRVYTEAGQYFPHVYDLEWVAL